MQWFTAMQKTAVAARTAHVRLGPKGTRGVAACFDALCCRAGCQQPPAAEGTGLPAVLPEENLLELHPTPGCGRMTQRWRMRQTRTRTAAANRTGRLAAAFTLAAIMLPAGVRGQQLPKMPTQTFRTISGIVTDDHHEPLHGVVVELENSSSHQIVSYLTAEDGRYSFKRLDSNTDFQVWATFRGHKSTVHSISMFDSHMQKVIDIVCKTY